MVDASDIYLAKAAPEKIEQHLKRPINATIGTFNADGPIHLAFVLFLWEGSKLYFETASMMTKARNVAARSTASFAIEGERFLVMAEGVGRIIDGDTAYAINHRPRQEYLARAAVDTVAAGDNPDPLRSERSWARLCGVSPIPAGSGKTSGRHRVEPWRYPPSQRRPLPNRIDPHAP
jgi:hypothetical protein